MKTFAEVAQQINAAIPLTGWQEGPPPMVGEYIASIDSRDLACRRWWDGKRWSYGYLDSYEQGNKNKNAGRRTGVRNSAIKYRGLTEEPIIVT